MGLWDKLSTELRTAGKAAQDALDEGKIRLEIFRVRQLADKSAQALGYAVHRARKEGKEADGDTIARLETTLTEHEAEATRLEVALAANTGDGVPPAPPPPSV